MCSASRPIRSLPMVTAATSARYPLVQCSSQDTPRLRSVTAARGAPVPVSCPKWPYQGRIEGAALDAAHPMRLFWSMPKSRTKTGPKKVSAQAITGQRGVNLVERIVLEMGCAWNATNQSTEAGIDGEIELIDPDTRAASNTVVRVQVKGTLGRWQAETLDTFEYPVDERDLAYWMSGNTPVILVVTRPQEGEAYWVDVKGHFDTPAAKKARKVRFDKRTMAFTKDSLRDLAAIALPKSMGLYFAPRPKEETLYTNLLRVTRMPTRLWLGETDLRAGRGAFQALRDHGLGEVEEFVLDNRRILTPHDLTDPRWRPLVDRGTVEEFPASDWADARDPEKRGLFVQLLNRCLHTRAWQEGIVRRKDDDALYFRASADLEPRQVPFQSVKEGAIRTVFKGYPYPKGDRVGEIWYYRHAACHAQFRRYDATWYLEILPTYHFTTDGLRRHWRAEELLAGIKKREKQGAVMYQVVMWAAILRGAEEVDVGLFSDLSVANTYPFLGFGPLQTLTLDVGIDDKAWLPNEDKETAAEAEATLGELPLFVDPDPYAPEPEPESGA